MTRGAMRVGGALILVLLAALVFVALEWVDGAFAEKVRVEVVLGESGQGLVAGDDVKARGVLIGRVRDIRVDDELRAVATLDLDPALPVPADSEFAVTNKTLFGPKQVSVSFDGPPHAPPSLADGERIDDDARVVELEDVMAELTGLLEALDLDDLAVIQEDFLGAFADTGPAIGRLVDEGARATETLADSADEQLDALAALGSLTGRLAADADELNRFNDALVDGLPTISDNADAFAPLLEQLSRAAGSIDDVLVATRGDLDRLFPSGGNLLRVLGAYSPEVTETVAGLTLYSSRFAEGYTDPTFPGQASRFVIMIDRDDYLFAFCTGLPEELARELPGCDRDQGAASGAVTPLAHIAATSAEQRHDAAAPARHALTRAGARDER